MSDNTTAVLSEESQIRSYLNSEPQYAWTEDAQRWAEYLWVRDHVDRVRQHVDDRYSSIKREDIPEGLLKLPPESSILISGPVGCGKTHIAWAWWVRYELDRIRQRFPQIGWNGQAQVIPQFFSGAELLERIRRSYDGDPFSIRDELLVLDDIGTERATEWVIEQLYRIVDERYRKILPVLVTTNLDSAALKDQLGTRVVSRLVEMCRIVKLDGSDKRTLFAAESDAERQDEYPY